MTESRKNPRKQAMLLSLLAVGMFGFAFALVPLYQVFCELTGLNGKTAGRVAGPVTVSQVSDREVKIQFLASVAKGMPWEFRPVEDQLRVRPGEINTINYYARNRVAQEVTGQAVPSVSPGQAAQYLHKVECFCFAEQRLQDSEEVMMPVRFYIDEALPEEIKTISLSYTMYKMPAGEQTNPAISVSYRQ